MPTIINGGKKTFGSIPVFLFSFFMNSTVKTNIYFAFPFVLFLLTFNIIIINLVDALMANS